MPELTPVLLLLSTIVIVALTFDFINGFHDTANAVATVISTRVLTPTLAIMMAAGLNLIGALTSTEVAQTVAGGLVAQEAQITVLAGLLGAIAWQLWTWYFGIPSSSSHALFGGLAGATIAHFGWDAVLWMGYWKKVIIPLFSSPLIGFLLGFMIMASIFTFFARMKPTLVTSLFGRIQILTAGLMAYAHGSNDAQKSMGIIVMALIAAGYMSKAEPKHLPEPAPAVSTADAGIKEEAHGPKKPEIVIPFWVVISCALAMAAGTAMGGHRIIKTMGHKIIRLEPVHGASAETAAGIVILGASHLGVPVSTTHVISGCIFGVGAAKRIEAVRWTVAQQMLMAWVLTLPMASLTSMGVYYMLCLFGVQRIGA